MPTRSPASRGVTVAPVSLSKIRVRSTACRARTKSRQMSLGGWPAGGRLGIRPLVGLSVTTPHTAAGHRSEPVASEPWATATAPAATAADDPPLDPPAERAKSQGLRVGAKPCGSVVTALDNAGHEAFPMIENPNSSKRAASGVVAVDRLPTSRNAATPT